MGSVASTIKRRFIKLMSKVYDPLVDLAIGNQTIKIPISHMLRENVALYPDYNFNLPRIIKYVSQFVPDVRVIDIGANIGDTVAFIKNYTDVPILCIDGEEKYLATLRKNVAKYSNVSICLSLVGAETKETNLKLKMDKGTAFVEESKEKTTIRTLENILGEFVDFKNSKIVKVDTDGYDTLILRGSENYLRTNNPMLFFEFDPFLISKNNDDPFNFMDYLMDCRYYYFIFYTNTGDYLLSCNAGERHIIYEVVNYFSGRKMETFADICAFHKNDEELYKLCRDNEIAHFKKIRNY